LSSEMECLLSVGEAKDWQPWLFVAINF